MGEKPLEMATIENSGVTRDEGLLRTLIQHYNKQIRQLNRGLTQLRSAKATAEREGEADGVNFANLLEQIRRASKLYRFEN